MTVSLIAALAANGVIGRGNALPWRLKEDLAHFKALTMNRAVIVGRRTFESIGRPLPGRSLIVLTSRAGYAPDGVEVAASLDDALKLAHGEEVFIAGGAEVYRQALPVADRLYLTRLERDYAGDTFFPPCDLTGWSLVHQQRHDARGDQPAFSFLTYQRAA